VSLVDLEYVEVEVPCKTCPSAFVHKRVKGAAGRNPTRCSTCRNNNRRTSSNEAEAKEPVAKTKAVLPQSPVEMDPEVPIEDRLEAALERINSLQQRLESANKIIAPEHPGDIAASIERRLRVYDAMDEQPTMSQCIQKLVIARLEPPSQRMEAYLWLATLCAHEVREILRHGR
jgi:hypothetical protein